MKFTLAVSALALACTSVSACSTGPTVNSATVSLIKSSEGFVASPAPDPVGYPTVGYGHKCTSTGCKEVPYSFPLSTSTASSLLSTDLKSFQNCINSMVGSTIKLNDNQYGALVSWSFNIGCSAAQTSTLIKRLNAGETPNTVAAEELPKWIYSSGSVLPGLVTRRNNEVRLFQTSSSVIAHPC